MSYHCHSCGAEQGGVFEVERKLPDELYLKPEEYEVGGVSEQSLIVDPNAVQTRYTNITIDNLNFTGLRTLLEMPEGERWRKGYPKASHVRAVTEVKKLLFYGLKFFYNPVKLFAYYSHFVLKDFYFRPEFFQVGGQEIYWASIKYFQKDKNVVFLRGIDAIGEVRWFLVMFFAMFYEFDDGWRYRLQFFFSNFTKLGLRENPRKELRRGLKMLIERELTGGMKQKWRMLKTLTYFAPVKSLAGILLETDLNKFRLDETDLYWAKRKGNFNYD